MYLRVLLITANVGSVFENINNGLTTWMQEVIKTVEIQQPEFVALHFQETGGKLYKNGSEVIHTFFSVLVENFKAVGFNLAEGFVDSDSDLQHQFTALSCVYFFRHGIDDIQIWDFQDSEFCPVTSDGRLFIGKDLQLTERKQKHKFPQQFFPNFKWSRKGFLRTRWRLREQVVDLVNIHLFHDSSNIVASSSFPSPFAANRQRTLNYLLDLFQNDHLENHPMFIFGDFNFRVDTFNVFPLLQNDVHEKAKPSTTTNNNKLQDVRFFVDSKTLIVKDHEEKFKHNFNWLLPYDFEAKQFDNLLELEINFHPTYPFDEDIANQFMRTRCPSWCDRVLFNSLAKLMISNKIQPEYNLIGSDVCMGDHKPVYLAFNLRTMDVGADTTNYEFGKAESLMEPASPSASIPSGRKVNPSSSSKEPSTSRKQCSLVSFLKDNLRKAHKTSSTCGKVPSSVSTNCNNGNWKMQTPPDFEKEISLPCNSNNATNNLLLFSPNELILNNSSTRQLHKNGQILLTNGAADESLLIEAVGSSLDKKDSSVILGTDDGCGLGLGAITSINRKKVRTPKCCCGCCCSIV